ncbi:hypothetical protein Tco_0987189 [Tanacetum coccineum]
MGEPTDYITATRKNFVTKDNEGRMIEKCIVEIQGAFLVKITRLSLKRGIVGGASEWFTKECIGSITTWDNMVEKKPTDVWKPPLCEAFHEFNYLLKIDTDLFTYDIQNFKTYDKYKRKLNNDKAKGTEEPWSENRVPYQRCDHICEPYRFKNGETKWPMCTSDIDGFCNGGELLGMVRVGSMAYFQDHRWHDELANGKLKDETLALKAKIKGSWGDATPGVIKFYR